MNVYGQLTLDDGGDIKAMRELQRIMKPNGLLILTTPYIGRQPLRISKFERNYNRERLMGLIKGFDLIKEEYFYPERMKSRLVWMKLSREQADKRAYLEPGIACLVLKKMNTRKR